MSRKNIVLLIIIAAIIAVAGFLAFKKTAMFAPPSVERSSFLTAEVEIGTVITTIEAEGVVEHENEVLLLSPASTKILKILKAPGSRVNAYQTILRLDPGPLQEEIGGLEDRLEVRRNNLQRTRLDARSTKLDLDYQVEMKKLRIASLTSELADQEELLEVGGISPARYDQTRQELTLANKELEMIQSKNSIRLQQLEVEERGLLLQIDIDEKELNARRETLNKTSVIAPSAGIVMSIEGKEGEMVSRDKLLVRISDLTSFKIRGSVEEKFAEFIKTGNSAYAELDNELLLGKIGTVSPEVQGNRVGFDVFLEESNHPKLLSNMNIKLRVISHKKEDVLRLKNTENIDRGSNVKVYVLEYNKLVQKDVTVGLIGEDYIEISSGLKAGEEVIISNTAEFRNRSEIDISY